LAVARLSRDPAPGAVVPPVAVNTAPSSAIPVPARPAGSSAFEPPPPARAESPVAAQAIPTAAVPVQEAEYSGYSQPIDAGPAFQKVMAQKPPPGTENRLGDLHRALERELRDDSWAYPLEAEIQNSLVAETSSGRLTVEHLECRATLCELRLSGSAANEQSLTDWSSSVGKQPWASRLYMNLSSSISDGERVDSLLIFHRPK
jgi:hypothetical protein